MKWIEFTVFEPGKGIIGKVKFNPNQIVGIQKKPIYRNYEDMDNDKPFKFQALLYMANGVGSDRFISIDDDYDEALKKLESHGE